MDEKVQNAKKRIIEVLQDEFTNLNPVELLQLAIILLQVVEKSVNPRKEKL